MNALTQLCTYWMLFFIYCVIGYAIECTYCRIIDGHWTNRGFLNGPYLPIWGTGSIMGALLFKGVTNPLIIFFAGGALCCAIEWVTSYVMEKLYHARWWDYSHLPLNFQGRFWIGGFVEFGIGLCVVALVVNPPLEAWLLTLPFAVLATSALVTLAVMGTDLVITHIGVSKMRDKMDQLVAETRDKAFELRQQALEDALKYQEAAQAMQRQAREAAEGWQAKAKQVADEREAGARELMGQLEVEAAERTKHYQELAESHESEFDERLAELRAKREQQRQKIREQFGRRESWDQALEWHLGDHLRAAREKARSQRPDLPQLTALDDVADRFRASLTNQERRVLNAFPEMRPSGYHDLAQELADAFTDDEQD